VEGGIPTRDFMDFQFAFATANNSGEAGAESDGAFFYTSMWNGTGFQKYNLDGSYVGAVSIGSLNAIRDMAYDPSTEHTFGGSAATTVFEWDFAGGTSIGSFTAPTAVRAIAYDDIQDGFWANNWGTTITLFDKSGTELNSFSPGAYASIYGFAFDYWNEGGPFLWAYTQDGSGNLIVQYEIATGTATGYTLDVTGILQVGTGIAGGLFSHPNVFNNTVTLGGNSQNDTFFGYELAPSGPIPGGLPEGLIGYNIYRDGDFVDYVAHVGDSPDVIQTYVEQNLSPGIYAYTATAVYDLTSYGFPGEEDESMEEGPAMVVVDYCFDLEFMETWELGNFDANNWTTDGANWSINGQTGQPAPAAEFTWDPIVTNYEIGLESYPLCAVGMTEGKIYLDFDLKLVDVNPTGEEFLHAQVWNWDSQTWMTVESYSNIDGSFGWESKSINIKPQAMGKVFKIRFHAMGVNSLNILSWFVDNIHVYRMCDAPTDLTSTVENDNNVALNWVSPGGGTVAEWIHWDDGVNYTSIGTGGAAEFDVAARWEPAQLVNYDGTAVTQVAFFPAEAAATYKVRVWTGGNISGPANMVVDQTVSNPVIGSWNYVTLTTPVPIDITQELWVGYYINTTTGYPAGCDDGPRVDGYGNMMNFGGWQTLYQINPELDYNWNIQAYVQSTVTSAPMPLGMEVESHAVPAGATLTMNTDYTAVNPAFSGISASRVLTGFNVWRNYEGGEYEVIAFVADPEVTYTDPDLVNGLYCYMVQAVYESETDYCESATSNETCEVISVGIADPNATAQFNMYPNPAVDHVFITSSKDLKRVTVYNALGQQVFDELVSGNEYELNTTTFINGIYMVRVENEAGLTTRALNIRK
jgi:hypothetical protein